MKYTRIFTGSDGQSHFEKLHLSLDADEFGKSIIFSADKILFGEVEETKEVSWHNPPCRQYVIMLKGIMEIETGDGTKQLFHPGDLLLAEDTTGQGHKTRAASQGIQQYLVIRLDKSA